MKIKCLSIFLGVNLFLLLPSFAQTKCIIAMPDNPHEDVLKEILRRSVVDAKEFESVNFVSPPNGLGPIDLTVQKEKSSDAFVIAPRNHFSGDYPATWINMERLNTQLTPGVLDHLEKLRKGKGRSVPEVADIFIGSLNWKRLEEKKPAEVVLEPRSEFKADSQPRLKLWTLLSEQLFYIFFPMAMGLLLGWPFGKSIYSNEWTKNFFTSLTSIFLTIPPIAVLCFFLPSFGMGRTAALVTMIAMNILIVMKESQKENQMGSSHFIGRLKKLVILNVNISTLVAFLGVGGFGSLISLGLALKDIALTLRGTLAVAFLAMALKWIFEGLEFALAKREERS